MKIRVIRFVDINEYELEIEIGDHFINVRLQQPQFDELKRLVAEPEKHTFYGN